MIFIPLGLGMFFPQAAVLSSSIRYLLMVMLFMVFLQLNLKELKIRKSHFKLLIVNAIVGVVSYLAAWWITRDETLAKAAFFVGITPTATAAAVVMRGASSGGSDGRSSTLMYSPVSAGEKKLRPRRPLPPVCVHAAATVPSGAPSSASSRSFVFVDGRVS